jgi:hypothetical protein
MKRLNLLLTLMSLNVLMVTIERFSFTTHVILQPYSFLRLHEVTQIMFIILCTAILSFSLLKEVSDDFMLLQSTRGTILALVFTIGIYFYAAGNGVHEVTSYAWHAFCGPAQLTNPICGSVFFNDYHLGNILYFLGALLLLTSLLLFERMNPDPTFTRPDFIVLFLNSLVYALAIFAYAAFDRVLVGLVYSATAMTVILVLLLTSPTKYTALPFTLYSAATYVLGTVASLVVRWH